MLADFNEILYKEPTFSPMSFLNKNSKKFVLTYLPIRTKTEERVTSVLYIRHAKYAQCHRTYGVQNGRTDTTCSLSSQCILCVLCKQNVQAIVTKFHFRVSVQHSIG
jgi:hypothetical protein